MLVLITKMLFHNDYYDINMEKKEQMVPSVTLRYG